MRKDGSMDGQRLDRRAFLMGSAGFGMAVMAGGTLAGCARGRQEGRPAPSPSAGDAEPAIETPADLAPDGEALVRRTASPNGLRILERAEAIGPGSRACELAHVDG